MLDPKDRVVSVRIRSAPALCRLKGDSRPGARRCGSGVRTYQVISQAGAGFTAARAARESVERRHQARAAAGKSGQTKAGAGALGRVQSWRISQAPFSTIRLRLGIRDIVVRTSGTSRGITSAPSQGPGKVPPSLIRWI
jgi:hypothetical protein